MGRSRPWNSPCADSVEWLKLVVNNVKRQYILHFFCRFFLDFVILSFSVNISIYDNPSHALCHIIRGRGGQLILFSSLENHLQYDIFSAFSWKDTRIVKRNSIFLTCTTPNHTTNTLLTCNAGLTVLLRLLQTLYVWGTFSTMYVTRGGHLVSYYGTLGNGWGCHIYVFIS